ncbi:signal peptidase I [Pseudonocardia sp. DSM 110487]|uniref:signal peptidase I n=1 Tax=Pseudonocardia sp. DSM 110487 TaxID=2865833 RepID=UPI001C69A3F4|nr:signal peptidase I [Pseudonocardia sp. DSM 110487]QYN36995.1 signal peptidase I [Pseudonocardia sp. DSM 110487]
MPPSPQPAPTRLFGRLLRIIRVQGDSMVPALHDGDRLLAVRPGPWRPLRQGAIVVGRVPAVAGGDGSALFIKRVLALPGEVARVPLDRLSAGRSVEQFGATVDGLDATWAVPAGHVFVKGDARDSADSVSWGAIPRGELVGVVVARLPPS